MMTIWHWLILAFPAILIISVIAGATGWLYRLASPRCERCGGRITGRRSFAGGQAYHPECWENYQ